MGLEIFQKLWKKGDVLFSDNVLALFAVMVAKLDFPIIKKKRPQEKKIDKFISLLYPVQLRGVLILLLFSRSRKEMLSFVIKKITTISSNSVNFILKLELENRA